MTSFTGDFMFVFHFFTQLHIDVLFEPTSIWRQFWDYGGDSVSR